MEFYSSASRISFAANYLEKKKKKAEEENLKNGTKFTLVVHKILQKNELYINHMLKISLENVFDFIKYLLMLILYLIFLNIRKYNRTTF